MLWVQKTVQTTQSVHSVAMERGPLVEVLPALSSSNHSSVCQLGLCGESEKACILFSFAIEFLQLLKPDAFLLILMERFKQQQGTSRILN